MGRYTRIVSELPKTVRRTALGFLCNALGRPAEPTGIPLSADRPVGHLYWDHEIDDLYGRLVELIEDVGLEEQLVVQGATTYITTHFGLWADPTFSKLNFEAFRTSIDRLRTQLELPIEHRDGRQSDDEINAFIQALSELIE